MQIDIHMYACKWMNTYIRIYVLIYINRSICVYI